MDDQKDWKVTVYQRSKDHNVVDYTAEYYTEEIIEELQDLVLEAEAKLAKAVECIERWQSLGCPDCSGDCSAANPPVFSCIMQMTLTTLAELKGGKE